jgi:hypothetical protein
MTQNRKKQGYRSLFRAFWSCRRCSPLFLTPPDNRPNGVERSPREGKQHVSVFSFEQQLRRSARNIDGIEQITLRVVRLPTLRQGVNLEHRPPAIKPGYFTPQQFRKVSIILRMNHAVEPRAWVDYNSKQSSGRSTRASTHFEDSAEPARHALSRTSHTYRLMTPKYCDELKHPDHREPVSAAVHSGD